MKKIRHTPPRREEVDEMALTIQKTFADFDVPLEVASAFDGLHSYVFLFKTLKPVRMRAIKSFEDDLRYALGEEKLEIEAPAPGLRMIGVRVPKKGKLPIFPWSDVVKSQAFREGAGLTVPLGKDQSKIDTSFNLAEAPHLLIGGATGTGKSMLLHSFINSLILKYTPKELRLVLIDIKRVEMVIYAEVPHLLTPVLTDVKKAVLTLKWLVKEMNRRYDILEELGVRDIAAFHDKVKTKRTKKDGDESMPYIVVVIDEMADLMMLYPMEFESVIVRLTQLSRAVGIHLVMATQRPSVNIITGLMKANIPTRIGFQVASHIDSRTIIDRSGAEKLNGRGDMLLFGATDTETRRFQSYGITDAEIKQNVKQSQKKYGTHTDTESLEQGKHYELTDELYEDDELYEPVRVATVDHGTVSTSFIQRKFGIGYSRAAKLMDTLEERGVIGPAQGSAPRKVLAGEVAQNEPRFANEVKDEEDYIAAKNLVLKTGKASATLLHDRLGFGYARATTMLRALEFFGIIGPASGSGPRKVLYTPQSYKKFLKESEDAAEQYSKSVQAVIDFSRQDGRVCPMPQKWNELWELLPSRKRVGAGWEPAAPLILAAWGETSDVEKFKRLSEHIRWADKHGALKKLDTFLRSLKETEWHHVGD